MAVIDSSTLILLAKVDMLDLVINNTKKPIVLTEEVVKESTTKKTIDALLIEKRIIENKLKIEKIKSTFSEMLVKDFNLGAGEAEALAFAVENKEMLMTDDKKAIKACKIFSVDFITSLSLAVILYKKQIINKEKALIYLEGLENYGRYSKEIIKRAKEDIK